MNLRFIPCRIVKKKRVFSEEIIMLNWFGYLLTGKDLRVYAMVYIVKAVAVRPRRMMMRQ